MLVCVQWGVEVRERKRYPVRGGQLPKIIQIIKVLLRNVLHLQMDWRAEEGRKIVPQQCLTKVHIITTILVEN